jgi:hypothetical protein
MRYWLTCLVLLYGVSGCSTIKQWRHRNVLTRIDRIFTECEAKHSNNRALHWTETVRCGNDGARSILAQSRSPYTDLIEAALASRLAIARQIDAGAIPEEEGKAKLAALDAYIHTLPGSTMDLLSMTAIENPR